MLNFCIQSLLREYGWEFLKQVALSHPVRTTRAILNSGKLDYDSEMISTFNGKTVPIFEGDKSIVGVGYCLKPLEPKCISGRFNHDCFYLEKHLYSKNENIPQCCKDCLIKDFGKMALNNDSAFYIMTSAKDILFDMFEPALNDEKFSTGLFVLCRYSLKPFTLGMLASGIEGWQFPFEKGDCRDYKTWVNADEGIKNERTCITEQNEKRIKNFLNNNNSYPKKKFYKEANIFYPE